MNPSLGNSAKQVFDQVDRDVWLATAASATARGGLIATCVVQASSVPEMPRVLVGLCTRHYTRELVQSSGAFALHLLGEEHIDWVWRFGLESGRDSDKFDALDCSIGSSGSPVLTGSLGWLDCRVEARWEAGDRTFYLGEVLDARLQEKVTPLTMRRLIELAPPERLRQLREQLARDVALDAQAIRDWRSKSSVTAPPNSGNS